MSANNKSSMANPENQGHIARPYFGVGWVGSKKKKRTGSNQEKKKKKPAVDFRLKIYMKKH